MDGHSATSTKVRISGSTKIDDFCGTRHAASHHKNNKIETTKPKTPRVVRKAQTLRPQGNANASKEHTSSDKRPGRREKSLNNESK